MKRIYLYLLIPVSIACLTALAFLVKGQANTPAQANTQAQNAQGQSQAQTQTQAQPNNPSQPTAPAVHSANQFSLAFFKATYHTQFNTFSSPFSLSSAFAMTYAGAKLSTREQLSQVFHYASQEAIADKNYFTMVKALCDTKADTSMTLHLANAVWRNKSVALLPNYHEDITKNYGGAVYPLTTAAAINKWAETNTHGMIKKVVSEDDMPVGTTLILTNALYFKALWIYPFEANQTAKKYFHNSPTDSMQTDIMSQTLTTTYTEQGSFKAVNLPYRGNKFCFTMLLPNEGTSIAQLLTGLSAHTLDSVLSHAASHKVALDMPKFSLTYEVPSCVSKLEQLGLKDAFQPKKANFTGISTTPMYIGKVVHKAAIEVNETGSRAAAVTAIHMRAMMAHPGEQEKVYSFKADRPFVYMIRDVTTNLIVFMGSYVNPY